MFLLHNFKELEITRSFGKHDPSSVYFEISENVLVAGTSYQMLEPLSFFIGRGLNLLQYK